MVRYLSDREKQRCRPLWEEAFPEDSPAFVDYYFAEKMKDNRVLVREEDGVIQSMLHLNPYCLAVNDGIWQADYIVGVATRSDCRRRGYMREIMDEMFADLWNRKMPFVFLMPAAKEIYEPFDFVYIYNQPVWQLKENSALHRRELRPDNGPGNDDGSLWRSMTDWMGQWLADRYRVYAIRDKSYLERLGKELASEQGKMEVLYDRDRMVGIYAEWGTKAAQQRLLYAESSYVTESESKPAIMARIVNLNAFLGKISLKATYNKEETQILLRLADDLIPGNRGLWTWNLTKETSWAEADKEELRAAELTADSRTHTGELPVLELSIAELTSWLMGYSLPEAVRQHETAREVAVLQNIFLDEVV